jgi:hypothetical protein
VDEQVKSYAAGELIVDLGEVVKAVRLQAIDKLELRAVGEPTV